MVQQNARGKGGKAPEVPPPPATPAPTASPTTNAQAAPPAGATPEAPAIPPEPAKPAESPKPPEDERAKALAEFVRGQQRNRTEAKRLHAEAERIKAEDVRLASTAEKQAQLEARFKEFEADPVAAVEKLLGRDKFSSEFLLKALDRVSKMEGGEQVTDEQRQEVIAKAAAAKVREELKAEQEAEAARVTAEETARNEQGQARYFGHVETFLRENEARFPNMAEEGWNTQEMVAAVAAHRESTGQWPTAEMVLNHFEAKHVARAETYDKRRGRVPAAAAKPPAPPSPAAAPVRAPADMKGKPSKPMPQGTLEERKAEIAARLDGMRTG
jgi:hypothetical protein